ncbi:MAG: phosphatidylglycerol lysyltransferase domain-containing protein [Bacteroidales bacterium]|nr:phosphatidylglycerol lysyltransferase domain-containing protein [Bacteroidales bacterium]MCD8394052.1 phosphatidylglycerol lysyltransferase domain-containing protein [Bacteroidales bacterium]
MMPVTTVDRALRFKPVTLQDIPLISRLLAQGDSRTCDYTIGGIYMWIDYFRYSFAVEDNTLFIKGVTENHRQDVAFSLPIGPMPLGDAVGLIHQWCQDNGQRMRFSAIPEDKIQLIASCGRGTMEVLDDWADYLYNINDLATLTGKRYNKKRNHVNRFAAENPEASLDPLTEADVPALLDFVSRLHAHEGSTADNEMEQVRAVLENWQAYPFVGGVLRLTPGGEIAAFTVGEIIGDTLYLHIEKMHHDIAGAGETINQRFAAHIAAAHPEVAYINREEDCGDPGLRQAKLSYHPAMLLSKYNLSF